LLSFAEPAVEVVGDQLRELILVETVDWRQAGSNLAAISGKDGVGQLGFLDLLAVAVLGFADEPVDGGFDRAVMGVAHRRRLP
jgi:hypothetical protein